MAYKRLTQEEVIRRFREVHGSRYDYSSVEYKGYDNKVTIICRKHGDFEQLPSNHLQGRGCPICVGRGAVTMGNFIDFARAIHGDKYGYDRVSFTKVSDKVWIFCPEHGWFQQAVSSHIRRKMGCQKCANEEKAKERVKSKDEFVRQAREVHGDRYDYSKSVYINTRTKILIICKDCGSEFWQTPQNHISSYQPSGCPFCKRSIGEERVSRFLGENDVEFIAQYRIKNENLFCENSIMVVDFYLPNLNTIIEYNGEQHYKPLNIFGGIERFERQQERDMSLRQYCKEHKIKLIEIPYFQMSNIEEILTKELKIHKKRK